MLAIFWMSLGINRMSACVQQLQMVMDLSLTVSIHIMHGRGAATLNGELQSRALVPVQ
jgi:hypothetical protein